MKNPSVQSQKSFLIPVGALLISFLGLALFFVEKGDLVLFLNNLHESALDPLGKYGTHLGDGIFCVALALVCLFFSYEKGSALLLSYLVSGLFAQLGKRVFFPDAPRPKRFFAETADLHFLEGVKVSASKSFPSGHTTSAFALFLTLALFTKNRTLQWLCFVSACFAGLTRVYLAQHFFEDIVAGAYLGTLTAVAVIASLNHFSLFPDNECGLRGVFK